jgi:hypothetical protein
MGSIGLFPTCSNECKPWAFSCSIRRRDLLSYKHQTAQHTAENPVTACQRHLLEDTILYSNTFLLRVKRKVSGTFCSSGCSPSACATGEFCLERNHQSHEDCHAYQDAERGPAKALLVAEFVPGCTASESSSDEPNSHRIPPASLSSRIA